jgi:hypothetical protein
MRRSEIHNIRKRIPTQFIKSRKGGMGATLDYVEAQYVINVLDDTFNGNWSFEIEPQPPVPRTEKRKKDGEWKDVEITEYIVLGKLRVPDSKNGRDLYLEDVVKQQFGSCDAGDGMKAGDALKGAGSDALKKCASLMGLGAQLYGSNYFTAPKASAEVKRKIMTIAQEHDLSGSEIVEKFAAWSRGFLSIEDAESEDMDAFNASLGSVTEENSDDK